MSANSIEQATAPEAACQFEPIGAGLTEVLSGLFDRARDRMDAQDMARLSALQTEAGLSMKRLSELCVAVGCLIAADKQNGNAGNYQTGDDVPDLLWLIGGVAEYAAALTQLAQAADLELAIADIRATGASAIVPAPAAASGAA